MNGMHVCGQTIVETGMYYNKKTTTGKIRIVRYSKRYVYYSKKTTTGTVGIVQYSKRRKSTVRRVQYSRREVITVRYMKIEVKN